MVLVTPAWRWNDILKNKKQPERTAFLLVPRTRLELAHRNRHHPLKVACLPISPSGLESGANVKSFFISAKLFTEKLVILADYKQH